MGEKFRELKGWHGKKPGKKLNFKLTNTALAVETIPSYGLCETEGLAGVRALGTNPQTDWLTPHYVDTLYSISRCRAR